MKLHCLALSASAVLTFGGAQAQTISLTSDIGLIDPVFNRPFTLAALSVVGTAGHDDAISFVAASSDPYCSTMVSGPSPNTRPTFLILYTGVSSGAAPLTGLVALNDGLGGTGFTSSGFSYALTADSIYTAVSTAYANKGVGSYATTIAPTAVPESDGYALMFAGMAGIALTVNRRCS